MNFGLCPWPRLPGLTELVTEKIGPDLLVAKRLDQIGEIAETTSRSKYPEHKFFMMRITICFSYLDICEKHFDNRHQRTRRRDVMGASKEWYLRNFVEALLGAKDVVLAPDLLLKRVDAVTISGFISLRDLGKIIDDLPCGLARLNDSVSILHKTLALFDVATYPRFPPPQRGETSVNGHLSASRADLAVFLLKLEAYGAPINPESLALSVAEEALKRGSYRISSSELDCVFYSRGKLSFPPFEMGFGMGAVPADPHTFETPTGWEVCVDDRPKQYWVRIRAKPIRPLTLSTV